MGRVLTFPNSLRMATIAVKIERFEDSNDGSDARR